MKSFESEIKRIASKTRLKAAERDAVRERILSYMEYHPLKKGRIDIKAQSGTLLQHEDFIYISWNSFWVKAVSGALSIVLILGVPLLAERSVPGDILYLVKTGVNEGIRTQLATTPYEKVALETRLMERRIAEARLLASEGKLTTEVEAQIVETVKGHAAAVQNELAEIRENDADGAALAEIVFSTTLEVQSAVLNESEDTGSSSVSSLISAVDTVRSEVDSDDNLATPSYDGLLARIEQETTRAYELFTAVKEDATAEEIVDIERRLADIDRSIVAGKTLKETDETASIAQMMDVLSLIQKLITFMTDIDVRETVALETLVPVVPTAEERITRITERLSEIARVRSEAQAVVENITDTALLEKIAASFDTLSSLTTEVEDSLSVQNLDTAETSLVEAEKVIGDAQLLVRYALEEAGATPVDVVPEEVIDIPVSETTGTTTDQGIESEELVIE